ncbi:DUF4105 domain-containing protein [Sulfurimonas sp. MAG313]|nr:DUF4105 domain-containing protein [Sulfurimonas sp. MAG313]MDF1879948.1 DUF4105 domain-containing protein [Sulfurimonas sp. MAG313]
MPDSISEIDDPSFFISPEGKTNAKAELEATIYALEHENVFDDNATACKFPARKWWLEKELGMKDLIKLECKEFNDILRKVDPQSASLIFPSAYIKSPASMFGHTFLRIDSSYKSKMLSYAVNYAADANSKTENGFVFAMKGLFGGYYGRYSLMPYYDKVKEYRDTEERDIWEYDLNLSPRELEQMMRHIWEIRDTYSSYYFFTKNCSYNILWLIEIAREEVHVREYFEYQVLPPETIHALIKEGVVEHRYYRPARRARLLAYEKYLRNSDIEDAFALSQKPQYFKGFLDTNKSLQTKMYIVEASTELIEYDYLRGDINKSVYRQRLHTSLGNRASLGKGDVLSIKRPEDPMQGHRSLRVRTEVGVRNNEAIGFIGIRPANHDLKDPDLGFLRGTQIEFFDVLLSYTQDKLKIEKATLLSITSLSPRGKFFKPLSWGLNIGWDRNYLSESTKFTSSISAGYTWGNELGYAYILADALVYTDKSLTAGIAGVLGLALYESKSFKTNLELKQRLFDTGKNQLLFSASQSYLAFENLSFSLRYEYVEKYEDDWKIAKLTCDYFF